MSLRFMFRPDLRLLTSIMVSRYRRQCHRRVLRIKVEVIVVSGGCAEKMGLAHLGGTCCGVFG